MGPKKKAASSVASVSVSDTDADTDDIPVDRLEAMLVGVTKALTDSFNTCMDKLIYNLEKKLEQRFEFHTHEVFELNHKLDNMEKLCKDQAADHKSLTAQYRLIVAQVDTYRTQLDTMEQYSRNENLLIHGVELPTDAQPEVDLQDKVVNLLNMHSPTLKSWQATSVWRTAQRDLGRPPKVSTQSTQTQTLTNLHVPNPRLSWFVSSDVAFATPSYNSVVS